MIENTLTAEWIDRLTSWIAPLGYEIVHLEIHKGRTKTLRIFIDFLNSEGAPEGASDSSSKPARSIGVEDCAKVSRTLDEPLDHMPELEKLFQGPYELEVSSPGVDRPLRTPKDFQRFRGKDVRIQLYRPLSAEEIRNPLYQQKNPRQKSFVGLLKDFQADRVILDISTGSDRKEEVSIPLALVSKANIEPKFDWDAMEESG